MLIIKAYKIANHETSEKSGLQLIVCIYYPTQINRFLIKRFINSGRKVNVMQPSFVRKPSLFICKINTDAGKIDGSKLGTYEMIMVSF